MCITCHSRLSNEDVVEMLKKDTNFCMWNSTSVSHLFIARSGANGTEAAELARSISNKFWWYCLLTLKFQGLKWYYELAAIEHTLPEMLAKERK